MKLVSGLDVHKDSVFMCILQENGEKIEGKYGTMTPDLNKLRETLLLHKVEEVCMESTGVYWIPVWNKLVDFFELKLVNPYFIKQLPGRKTDVKDAEWIATVLQKELVRGSYVPCGIIQEMRQYERGQADLRKRIVYLEQRIDMQLQRCNIRLSNYVTDIGGVSMRKVVKAIIQGETRPEVLSVLVHGRITNKHGHQTITDSLSGIINSVDVFMLKQYMDQLELLEKQEQECLETLSDISDHYFKNEMALLMTIPGVQKQSAMTILAELGADMKMFATAAALVGWAGLRPRNEESAGKIKSRKTLHGNKFLRIILVQCAWAASRTKKGRLGDKYRQLASRMRAQKALVAISRKLLVIIWNVLSKKEAFDPNRGIKSRTRIKTSLS
jgi:transposase